MDKAISDYLTKLEMGKLQEHENMAVVPLFFPANGNPKYLTLEEALEQEVLKITEVSEGGSVPELKVTSTSELPVLLLDSEELMGAKQNRVLNTSILIKAQSDTQIPVSCTEQGRWSYSSAVFSDSGTMTSSQIRRMKHASVTGSLRDTQEFRSDQAEVWREVTELHTKSGTSSSTGAMRAAFEAHAKKLDEFLKAFEYLPKQRGLLVFINGEPTGLDVVSLERAYETLHPKLIKSYAMDAMLEENGKGKKPTKKKATGFLQEAMTCHEERFESVGQGWDYRYETDTLVGSALADEKHVVHVAFFRMTEEDRVKQTLVRRRRDFRTGPIQSSS